jgi:hypothetical protein
MTASCLAGSIGRRELFKMPAHARHGSPLRGHFREFMAPYIDAIPFKAPEPPLVSCLERKALTTYELGIGPSPARAR